MERPQRGTDRQDGDPDCVMRPRYRLVARSRRQSRRSLAACMPRFFPRPLRRRRAHFPIAMLNNLSIKSRLIFVIGLLSLASFIVGIAGLRNLSATNDSLKTVYNDRLVALAQLG